MILPRIVDPFELVLFGQRLRRMRLAYEALKPREKTVVYHRVILRLTFVEIGRRFAVHPVFVRSLWVKARHKMRVAAGLSGR